jgi:hypothetical protein
MEYVGMQRWALVRFGPPDYQSRGPPLKRSRRDLANSDLVAAGAAVPAIRAGDAAHGVLCRGGGNGAEAEEGSECKCEREFHDPSPLVQGIAGENGFAALRDKFHGPHCASQRRENSKFPLIAPKAADIVTYNS